MFISELTYTDEQLEQDTVRFIKTQIYAPSFAPALKEFMLPDILAFRNQFNDVQNHFESIWYDEFQKGNIWKKGKLYPRLDREKLENLANTYFMPMLRGETSLYFSILQEKYNTPKCTSIIVPYRNKINLNLAITALNGYGKNPWYSIFNISRNFCLALHEKKFRNSEQFKLLQEIHANIFANLYIYLKALESGDKQTTIAIRYFIYQNSAENTEIDGESINLHEFDYPITKYVIQSLDPETASSLYNSNGELNFIKLYNFSFESIFQSGFAPLYLRDENNYTFFHLYIGEVNKFKLNLSKQQILEKFLYEIVENQYLNQEKINPYLLREEEARRYLTPFDNYLDKYPALNETLQEYLQMKKNAELYHFQTREKIRESRAYQIEISRH